MLFSRPLVAKCFERCGEYSESEVGVLRVAVASEVNARVPQWTPVRGPEDRWDAP
jgi:hypothetical protein